jgi:AraC family transcriptional regulator, regulatory protein of adaptative response / methylated-DNA-[protein]-cysteine methyltransferase
MNAPMDVAMKQDPRFATEAAKWAAVQRRDPQADGHFFYSVATTGVYCWPSCAARPARRENVGFHSSPEAAERAGFRPCKRCKPTLPPRAEREAALVASACRRIEAADGVPSLADIATDSGVSANHFHRLFKRITGVTPKAYADAHRQRQVQSELRAGRSVTDTIYEAGFNSSGRFYEAAPAMLGMTPSAYRAGGSGEEIHYATGKCSLGRVLVGATARGICAIQLGDSVGALEAELATRFPKAKRLPAGPALADALAVIVRMVDAPNGSIDLPLDIRGTAFQRRVWEALRAIPPGATATYTEVAKQLGNPAAVRAVAGACAANALAVVIPCHRVIAVDGKLAGYRWGVERKRQLLAKERG